MQAIARFITALFIVGLILLIAPAIVEIVVFCFVVFLQVVITLYIVSLIISAVKYALKTADEDNDQKAYAY